MIGERDTHNPGFLTGSLLAHNPSGVTGSPGGTVTAAAGAREVSVVAVAAGAWASDVAALGPSSGVASFRDFDVSRVLSSNPPGAHSGLQWIDQPIAALSYAPGAKNLRVSGCLLILLPQDSHSKPGGHDGEGEHSEEFQGGFRHAPTRV